MDEALRRLARDQAGVVTRAQARAHGVPASQLGGPDARTLLVRVRPGVYAERRRLAGLDLAARAAVGVAAERLVSRVDLVASGLTAALVHGLPVVGPLPAVARLSERREERPRHHGRSVGMRPDETTVALGVPVTSLARTAADVARQHGLLVGVVVTDAVLARGVDRAEVQACLQDREHWPGAAAAVRAVELADGRAESPLESVGRVRLHQQGLPAPQLQVWLGDECGPVARVDHYWAAHRTVAEADGAVKYQAPGDLFAEKLREDRLRSAGFEVVRYTWDEAWTRPALVAARVRAAFARAAARRRSA